MIQPQQTQELSPALSSQIVPKNILAKSKGYNQKQSEPHTQRLRFLKSFSYQKIELILKGVLMDDLYQNSSFSQLDEPDPKEKTMDLFTKDLDYMEKIKELQGYLDMVNPLT